MTARPIEQVLKATWTALGRERGRQRHCTIVPATPSSNRLRQAELNDATRMNRKFTESVANTIGNRTFRPEVRMVTRK